MADPAEALRRVIATLREDYASKLPENIAGIEELWQRLLAEDAPPAGLEELVRRAHGIAGSGMTFGLAAAGEAARELERFLEALKASGRAPGTEERSRVAALIAALKQTVSC